MILKIILTAVFLIISLVLHQIFKFLIKKRLSNFILGQKNKLFKTIYVKKVEFIKSDDIVTFFLTINKILYVALNLFLLIVVATMTFHIWPTTKFISDFILKYSFDFMGKIFGSIVSFVPNLVILVVIIVIVYYSLKIIKFFATHIEKGKIKIYGFYPDWVKPTYTLIRLLIITFAAIVAFPYLPASDTPAFKGVSIFIGVIFSLSSTSILGNIIAGIVLTYMRSFSNGDSIKVNDIVGDVVEKNLFTIKLKTSKNEIISIPNSSMLSANILNYTNSIKKDKLIITTTVMIGYDIAWQKVYECLINAALSTQNILDNPTPFVLQTKLDNFYVSYQVNAYVTTEKGMGSIYSELHQNIQDEFNKNGIEMVSPNFNNIKDFSKAKEL